MNIESLTVISVLVGMLAVLSFGVGVTRTFSWCNNEATSSIKFLLLFFIWCYSDGMEIKEFPTRSYTTEKVLVSTQPPHSEVSGSLSGSFLYFSGSIGENRVYLLREEISQGLYKDFQVKNEVFIREDNDLITKGKFVQYFQCYDVSLYYEIIMWPTLNNVYEDCRYVKQEIVVPVGSVVKEIKI